MVHVLHKVGCTRHSLSKLSSALAGTTFVSFWILFNSRLPHSVSQWSLTPFVSSMVFSPPSVPPFPGGQKRYRGTETIKN